MTAEYDDLPWEQPDEGQSSVTFVEPTELRKCRKHVWRLDEYQDDPQSRVLAARMICARPGCGKVRDEAVIRRNRRNRGRGKSTSHELAAFLGWQDVEKMGWSWDVQGAAGRIQSKRDLHVRGPIAALGLIQAIPQGDYLRGLYHVTPARRLTSGEVTFLLEEWVAWHGWNVPLGSRLSLAGALPLVTMGVGIFRDVHCARAAA